VDNNWRAESSTGAQLIHLRGGSSPSRSPAGLWTTTGAPTRALASSSATSQSVVAVTEPGTTVNDNWRADTSTRQQL